jgi:hypothetical protein
MTRASAVAAVGALLLSLACHTHADLPLPFEAKYKAKYRGISVTAVRTLKTLEDGSQYYSFIADSLIADLAETSQFRWSDTDRVVPIRYTYERSVMGRERKAEVLFNWDKHKVTNNVEDKPWQMSIPTDALDKLSYQIQLRADLINGKTPGVYAVADGGKLKQYRFEIVGEESLATRAGRFDVIKVRRLREENEERQTVIWFAKNWNYLVVRLQQEEDDKSYEIDMVSATLNGKPVKGGE